MKQRLLTASLPLLLLTSQLAAQMRGPMEPPIPVPTIPLSELAATVAAEVERRAAEGRFSGAVLVAKDGEPLFARAYGLANAEEGVANTLDTPLALASMNKMFTGLAIAQLIHAGKLSPDDTIGEHLPEWPNEVAREKVTVQHLLTHTSGMGDYLNQEYWENRDWFETCEDFAALFAHEDLDFEPGTGTQYSNAAPVVLGLILEQVTGQSYYDYVREHVYRPAGMTRSDHFKKTDAEAGVAHGYMRRAQDAPWTCTFEAKGLIGSPAGSGYATANDLLRFSKALLAGKLLPREALEEAWKLHNPDFETGWLWHVQDLSGHRVVGHNGGGGGASTDFGVFPELGYTVVVLCNRAGQASRVSEWIKETIARNAE